MTKKHPGIFPFENLVFFRRAYSHNSDIYKIATSRGRDGQNGLTVLILNQTKRFVIRRHKVPLSKKQVNS